MPEDFGPRIIKALLIEEGVEEFYRDDGDAKPRGRNGDEKGLVLDGLGAVNLFVGANNSGKSRLMRAMMTAKNWWVDARPLGISKEIHQGLAYIVDAIASPTRTGQAFTAVQLEKGKGTASALKYRRGCTDESIAAWVRAAAGWQEPTWLPPVVGGEYSEGRFRSSLNEILGEPTFRRNLDPVLQDANRAMDELRKHSPSLRTTETRSYYPILRGLRPLVVDMQGGTGPWAYHDLYADATVAVYKDLKKEGVRTGLTLYEDVRAKLLGKREDRDHLREYENFLSQKFFENKPVALVPHESNRSNAQDVNQGLLHIDIGGIERPIHLLGDGLQQLILLTWQPYLDALEKKPAVYFIEEPELYLHPGMQRRLLQFFLEETPHLYFATTHSNHLLDMSMDWPDVAIYNFWGDHTGHPDQHFRVWRVNRGDQSTLQLLGVRASSVFLVNATLWVEGVTDRRYIRQYLRMLVKHLETSAEEPFPMEEDVHYAFVEYQGANITHWSFSGTKSDDKIAVERICAHAFVLADTDEPGTKVARKEDLKRALGDRFRETAGREIENMLPLPALRGVIARLAKIEHARIPAFTREEYCDELLGSWIDSKLQGTGVERTFAEPSRPPRHEAEGPRKATIKEKVNFCDLAIEELGKLTWDDLDEDVQALVRAMYEHVRRQNGR